MQNNGYLKIAQYFITISVDQWYFQLANSPNYQLFILNIRWLKVNDIVKWYVFIDVASINYLTWFAVEYVAVEYVWQFVNFQWKQFFSIVACLRNFHCLFLVIYSYKLLIVESIIDLPVNESYLTLPEETFYMSFIV